MLSGSLSSPSLDSPSMLRGIAADSAAHWFEFFSIEPMEVADTERETETATLICYECWIGEKLSCSPIYVSL